MTERIVKFKLSAEADGADNIRALTAEVDKLAAEGGAAAPAFKKLSDELKKLSEQQATIAQFAELKRRAEELKKEFDQSAASTAAVAKSLRDKKDALASATTAEQASAASVKKWTVGMEESKVAILKSKAELAKLKEETLAAGAATGAQSTAIAAANATIRQHSTVIAQARAELAAIVPVHRAQATEVKSAASSLKQSTAEFEKNRAATSSAKTEYERTSVALQTTRDRIKELGIASNDLAAAQLRVKAGVAQASQEVENLKNNAGKSAGVLSALGRVARGAFGQVTALLAGVAGLTEFVRVNVELENINRTLRVITGSSELAAKEMDFLRDVSTRLGLELVDTSKSYAQFAASTKGTALEGKQTRDVFEAVARAMSVAGKSAADTSSALNALGQMVSKGVVSMEELRGQLGDRLPGAMKAAADGLGITTAQLVKMVSEGRVLAVDLLPKLATALNETYKAGESSGQTLQQQWNLFRNAISSTGEDLGKSGIITSMLELGRVIATVTAGIGNFVSIVGTMVGSTFGALFQQVSILGSAIANFSFDGFVEKSRAAAQALRDSMGTELDRAANSIRRFSEQSTLLQWALNLVGLGSETAAVAVAKTAEATTKAGAAAQEAGLSWIKLGVIYKELKDASDSAVQASEKGAAARKAEGEASLAMATAFGTEIEQRKATAEAAAGVEAALQNLARARTADLSLMQSELVALQEWMRVNKDSSKERQTEIDELQKKIAVRKEETDKAVAQAQASKVLTEQARFEVAAHADNSARLGELRDAYGAATTEVDRLRLAKMAGNDVTVQLSAAELKAAKAAALYRDALKDQQAVIEANSRARQAQFSLSESLIHLQIEEARTDAEVAKAKGNERAERQSLNRVRELEIELAQLQAKALRAEAEATLEMIRVKREDLKARGELTKVAEAELKATEAAAQAKKVQADIADETANRLDRVKSATDAVAQSSKSAAGGVDGLSWSLSSAAGNADKLATGLKKVNGSIVNQDGMVTDAQGNVITATDRPNPTMDQNGNWAFVDSTGQFRRSQQRPVEDGNGAWMDPQMKAQMDAAAMPRKSVALSGGGQLATFGGVDGGLSQPAPQPQEQSPRKVRYEVELKFGNRAELIETASEKDAKMLTDLLLSLGSDMRRAN